MVDAVVNCSPTSVLDVATGPAGVALEIAARTSAQVTGVDLTPQMLEAGAANVARSPQAGRVHLALGRGEDLPFADATFDALTFTSVSYTHLDVYKRQGPRGCPATAAGRATPPVIRGRSR